ncbi:MAG: hypothetical protein ACLFOY_12990 [Desulfatibacillaceae bacterium]
MKLFAIITISVLVGLGLLRFILRFTMHRTQKNLLRAVKMRRPGASWTMIDGANFMGLASAGVAQVRGNGILALNRDELYFLMAVPRREIAIPLTAVRDVDLVRSHTGKTVGHALLRVMFDEQSGQDSVAWAVRNPEQWKRNIQALSGQA